MSRLSRLWVMSFLCWWAGASVAFAKDVYTIFVQEMGGNAVAKRTAAELAWLLREASKRDAAKKGLQPLDRGMFFSNAEALAAGAWLQRAERALQEGLQNYTSDPLAALEPLLKANRFYEFTFAYFPVTAQMQRARIAAGLLYLRKGERAQGLKVLQTGILLEPKKATEQPEISEKEKEMIEAASCHLASGTPASLLLESSHPGTELYLNDRFVGLGRAELTGLRAGTYMIKAMLDGYRHFKRSYTLGKGAKGRVSIRVRPGPRLRSYEELCEKFTKITDNEQLKDELKALASLLKSKTEESKRLLLGCFKPSGNGDTGSLLWFSLSQDAVKKGTARITAEMSARLRAGGPLLQSLGLRAEGGVPSMMQYPLLPQRSGCPDPSKIELPALMPSRSEPPMWTVSPGDIITLSTRYGFRMQGKVTAIDGEVLTLEVSTNKRDNEALQRVQIHRKEVKWTFILGPKQEGGYRIGERLIILTVFGTSASGSLAADDGEKLRLQTKRGTEVFPWSMIRRVIRRDG